MPQREPIQGTATLTLRITVAGSRAATEYLLTYLEPHPKVAASAWRLRKITPELTFYDVMLLPTGPECTCPDFIFCREHKDPKGCKHIAALRAVRILEGPQ